MFVTRMLRYGDIEMHSYIVGVYTTRVQAVFAGEAEASWRGGKYEPIIEEFEVDAPTPVEVLTNHNMYKDNSMFMGALE